MFAIVYIGNFWAMFNLLELRFCNVNGTERRGYLLRVNGRVGLDDNTVA